MCVPYDQIDKLKAALPPHLTLKEHFFYKKCLLKLRWTSRTSKEDLFIDIFVTNTTTDPKYNKEYHRLTGTCANTFNDMWYTDELYPLKRMKFCNGSMSVPNNPYAYLKRLFGKNYNKTLKVTHYHFGNIASIFSHVKNLCGNAPSLELTDEVHNTINEMNQKNITDCKK